MNLTTKFIQRFRRLLPSRLERAMTHDVNASGLPAIYQDIKYLQDLGYLPSKAQMVALSSTISLTKNDQAAAAANLTALQAALDAGGLVSLVGSGTAYLSATPLINSDTTLRVAAGLRLKSVDGTHMNLLAAKYQDSPKVTLTNWTVGADIQASGSGNLVIITWDTSAAHGWSVGDYILIKGDTTDQYVGGHKVYAVPSTTQVSILMPAALVTSGYNIAIPAPAGTVTAQQCINNVVIEGGIWDANGPNRPVSGGDSYLAFAIQLNKVTNLTIKDVSVFDASKYALALTNCFGVLVDTPTFRSASDGLHLQGPCRNVVARNLRGLCYDDIFSYTATNEGYLQYNFPGYVSSASPGLWDQDGELINCTIEGVNTQRQNFRMFFGPKSGFRMAGVTIRDYKPNYAQSTDNIVVSSEVATLATVEDFTIIGANGASHATGGRLMSFGKGGASSNTYIKNLTIQNLIIANMDGDVMANEAQIDFLTVKDCDINIDTTAAAARYLINSGPTAARTIKRVMFDNVRLRRSAGTQAVTFFAGNTNLTINEVVFDRCCFGAGTGGIAGAFANGPTIRYQGCTNDGGTPFGMGTLTAPVTVIMDDMLQISAAAGGLLNLFAATGTYNLYLSRLKILAGNFVVNNTSASTKNLFIGDGTVAMDFSTLTGFAPQNGAIFYNTGAAYSVGIGLYAKAAGGVTRIAA
jgi:hypothetical protein